MHRQTFAKWEATMPFEYKAILSRARGRGLLEGQTREVIGASNLPRLFVLLLSTVTPFLNACDPSGGAEAIVVDASGAPVVDAHVSLYCPAPNKERSQPTDAKGMFSILSIAMDDDDCVISIDKPGYISKKWPVSAACRSPNTPKCRDKPVRLVLERAP